MKPRHDMELSRSRNDTQALITSVDFFTKQQVYLKIQRPFHESFIRWSAFFLLFLIMPKYFNSANARENSALLLSSASCT